MTQRLYYYCLEPLVLEYCVVQIRITFFYVTSVFVDFYDFSHEFDFDVKLF